VRRGDGKAAYPGPMDTIEVTIRTGSAAAAVDVTAEAAAFVAGKGDGLLSLFVPHATAGLAVVETGAGSDRDLLAHLEALFPRDERWRHRHGAPGHGADHVVPAFVSPSLTVPVLAGQMALGTWQSLVLVDPNGDNPTRRLRLSFLPA
jgi:secondary thiamine-phosphate synthase enzyme